MEVWGAEVVVGWIGAKVEVSAQEPWAEVEAEVEMGVDVEGVEVAVEPEFVVQLEVVELFLELHQVWQRMQECWYKMMMMVKFCDKSRN